VTLSPQTVVLLSSPKHPPRSGPPSARYQPGRGNILAERLLERGHDPVIWWDHPDGSLIDCQPDVVLVRSTRGENLARAHELSAAGLRVINDPTSHERARDKWFQAERFAESGIPHPITKRASEAWTGSDDVVVKPRIGDSGIGVRRLRATEIESGLTENDLVQEYVAFDHDYRVTVVGNHVLGWALRRPAQGEFRTNLSQGATWEPVAPPSRDAESVALRAVQLLGLDVAGVDLVHTHDGPVIIEVNAATTLSGPSGEATNAILDAVVDLIEG
jgi:ribosomal protein S6--L-glutamate ligase